MKIIKGEVKNKQVVNSDTGEKLDYPDYMYTQFEGIRYEIVKFKYSKKTSPEILETFQTLNQAIEFIEDLDVAHGNIVRVDIIGETTGEPIRFSNPMELYANIKKYLTK